MLQESLLLVINVNKKLIHEGHAYIYEGGKKKVLTESKNA